MAHSLKIKGIIIEFTATTILLEGKNNGSDISGYSFSAENEPNNNSTHQYRVISSKATNLEQEINLVVGDSLNVWTTLPKDDSNILEDPTTPRGTEVIVS